MRRSNAALTTSKGCRSCSRSYSTTIAPITSLIYTRRPYFPALSLRSGTRPFICCPIREFCRHPHFTSRPRRRLRRMSQSRSKYNFEQMLSKTKIPPSMRKKGTSVPRHARRKLITVERICGEPSLSGIGISQIAWSPDSKLVTYLRTVGDGNQLWAFDRATARRELLFDFSRMEKATPPKVVQRPRARSRLQPPPPAGPPSYPWSPAGDQILLSNGVPLFVLKPSTGALTQLIGGDELLATPPVLSDGRRGGVS